MWTHDTDSLTSEFLNGATRGLRGMDGGKFKRKLLEVNTRAVPRRQNELVGKFKMAAGALHNLPPSTNLITCTILNLSTNSFCLLGTALVLTSDNYLPSIPHNPLVAPFKNSLVTPSVSCVRIDSFPSYWERRLWPSKYFDSVSMCLHVPFLRWSLQFLVRSFPYI